MKQIDKYVLYGTRMLVFLEEGAQSNKYRQVHMDAAQFKKVSDAVCGSEATEGEEEVEIYMSTALHLLPDLQELNPPTS